MLLFLRRLGKTHILILDSATSTSVTRLLSPLTQSQQGWSIGPRGATLGRIQLTCVEEGIGELLALYDYEVNQ